MNRLIQLLLTSIKAKVFPIWNKIRLWINATFIETRIFTVVRNKLIGLFNVKPRDKKDYYTVGRIMISKRLIQALVIIIGILSLVYILFQVKTYFSDNDRLGKVYWYNSLPLRYTKGDVRIKAKDGYVAYDGNVEDGYCTGYGTLFDRDGDLVYKGQFEKNKFEGKGVSYYKSGAVNYDGDFKENLYNGTGKLFRENSTLSYEGGFLAGKKEGEGILYNGGESPIFTGQFHSDRIVYSQLLGKNATDISSSYTGKQYIYSTTDRWVVFLDEINAFYVASLSENSIDDSISIDTVYVYDGQFVYGDEVANSIDDVIDLLGNPSYEGNSYITLPEACAADYIGADQIDADMEKSHPFDEVYVVDSYDTEQMVYLYIFEKDDLTYTFVCPGKKSNFLFYSIMQ